MAAALARLLALIQVAAWCSWSCSTAQNIQITPPNGAFVLRRTTDPPHAVSNSANSTELTDVYLQNGCAFNADQVISQRMAGRAFYEHVYPAAQSLHCTVSVRLAKEQIYLDRPYVDIVVLRDTAFASLFKHRLCVTVQLTNQAGASVAGSCIFHERHPNKHSCLIRQVVPFSWFQLKDSAQAAEHIVSVSYSVKRQCSSPEIPLFGQRLRLLTTTQQFGMFAQSKQDERQLTILSRPNVTFAPDSVSSFLFHFKQNATENSTDVREVDQLHVKVFVDERFELVAASPLDPRSWRLRVETESEPRKHALLTLTYVGRERFDEGWDQFVLAILLRQKGRPDIFLRASMATPAQLQVHWNVEYKRNDETLHYLKATTLSDRKKLFAEKKTNLTYYKIVKGLVFGPDKPYVVVPVAKHLDIVNTAVLTGVQVGTTMRIYVATESGQLQDVTERSQCHAPEARLLKVAPTCTSVYVDGSELRGRSNAHVEVTHGRLSASAQFTVWYPKLPIEVWAADRTLNAIGDWRVPGWEHMGGTRRRRRDAKQSVCATRHQQTEIRVLAAFHVVDETTGEKSYLSGARDLFFDVTQLAQQRLHSSDPDVIALKRREGRVLAVGHQPGQARLSFKSAAGNNLDYGGTDIEVTQDRVSAAQLFIKVVADVQLQLQQKAGLPAQFQLMAKSSGLLAQKYQHATLDIFVFYSDGQKELLSDVDTSLYALSIFTDHEHDLKIGQQRGSSNVELVLLEDRPDIRLSVEIRSPPTCDDPDGVPLASGVAMLDTFSKHAQDNHKTQHIYVEETEKIQLNVTSATAANEPNMGLQPVLAALIILLLVLGVYHAVSGHLRGFHNGYEKLVMPLLARLSSNGSLASDNEGEGEKTSKEFVWLPRQQLDNVSVASHFSQRSTLNVTNGTSSSSSSSGNGTNRSVSVSYRGSEISVFISPQTKAAVSVSAGPQPDLALLQVNEDLRNQQQASWRSTNGRTSRLKKMGNGMQRYRYNEGAVSVHDKLSETNAADMYQRNSLHSRILRRSSDHVPSFQTNGLRNAHRSKRHRSKAAHGSADRFHQVPALHGSYSRLAHSHHMHADFGRSRPQVLEPAYNPALYYQGAVAEYGADSAGSSPEELTPTSTAVPAHILNSLMAGSIDKLPRPTISPRKQRHDVRETIA